MQQRLPKNSQDLVNKSFKNHIILKVIDKSCKQYESRMNTMRFSTTEIFVEVVSMIDDIREQSVIMTSATLSTIFSVVCANTTLAQIMTMQKWQQVSV